MSSPVGSSANSALASARPASALRFSAFSTRIGTGRTLMSRSPARCVVTLWAAWAAPRMDWVLKVKQSTRVSGRWPMQMSEVSLKPVRLSMST